MKRVFSSLLKIVAALVVLVVVAAGAVWAYF